jgi:hypothetical protein
MSGCMLYPDDVSCSYDSRLEASVDMLSLVCICQCAAGYFSIAEA